MGVERAFRCLPSFILKMLHSDESYFVTVDLCFFAEKLSLFSVLPLLLNGAVLLHLWNVADMHYPVQERPPHVILKRNRTSSRSSSSGRLHFLCVFVSPLLLPLGAGHRKIHLPSLYMCQLLVVPLVLIRKRFAYLNASCYQTAQTNHLMFEEVSVCRHFAWRPSRPLEQNNLVSLNDNALSLGLQLSKTESYHASTGHQCLMPKSLPLDIFLF